MVSKVGMSLFSFTTRIDGVGSSNFCAITANSDISLSWTVSRIKVMSASWAESQTMVRAVLYDRTKVL